MALAAYGKMNEDISDRLKDYLTINGVFMMCQI